MTGLTVDDFKKKASKAYTLLLQAARPILEFGGPAEVPWTHIDFTLQVPIEVDAFREAATLMLEIKTARL